MSALPVSCRVKMVPPSLAFSSEGEPDSLITPPSMIAILSHRRVSFLQVMRRHKHGDAFFAVKVSNVSPHVLSRLNIQPQCWFIQKQYFRVMNKSHCKLQPPSHSARISFNLPLTRHLQAPKAQAALSPSCELRRLEHDEVSRREDRFSTPFNSSSAVSS